MGVLCLTRSNNLLGPLRVTLTKMLQNLLQFFVIFALLMLAFAVSLTELYWYDKTAKGTEAFCLNKNNFIDDQCQTSDNSTELSCKRTLFTSMEASLQDLFWALFGHLDVDCIRKDKAGETYIDDIGVFLVGIYHISVIFVLLNMLIAMMTKSFDRTSTNKDAEWKFYRTKLWIRFIRQDYSAPPPMNILPNFRSICLSIKKVILQRCRSNCTSDTETNSWDDTAQQMYTDHKQLRLKTSKKLMERYKIKNFVEKAEVKSSP